MMYNLPLSKAYQKGAILLIVLWFLVVAAILVATMSTETQLSAKIVAHQNDNLDTWSETLTALRVAEMELMIAFMPLHPDTYKDIPLDERKNPRYRFDGRELGEKDFAYEIPKNVTVRIYDHAGKINLLRLSENQLRQLLKKQLGDNQDDKIDELIHAWQDWIDADDLKRTNGAEKEYYERLKQPYQPRNGILETVEELRLIKGFDEVFKGVDLNTAFTVYGSISGVNPNIATREALLLLPGLDSESVDKILVHRREEELKSHNDFNRFIELEDIGLFLPWVNFSVSPYFSIAVQNKKPQFVLEEEQENDKTKKKTSQSAEELAAQQQAQVQNERGYLVTVMTQGSQKKPRTLYVNPYGVLPDNRHMSMTLDELEEKN